MCAARCGDNDRNANNDLTLARNGGDFWAVDPADSMFPDVDWGCYDVDVTVDPPHPCDGPSPIDGSEEMRWDNARMFCQAMQEGNYPGCWLPGLAPTAQDIDSCIFDYCVDEAMACSMFAEFESQCRALGFSEVDGINFITDSCGVCHG